MLIRQAPHQRARDSEAAPTGALRNSARTKPAAPPVVQLDTGLHAALAASGSVRPSTLESTLADLEEVFRQRGG